MDFQQKSQEAKAKIQSGGMLHAMMRGCGEHREQSPFPPSVISITSRMQQRDAGCARRSVRRSSYQKEAS